MGNNFSKPASVSCSVPQSSILGPLLILIYVNYVSQAVKCDLFLYVDDTSLVCEHKGIKKIENQLNEVFCNICDWFVDTKLSIHFSEDNTKSILFASKFKRKTMKRLHRKYGDIQIKQHSKVNYLGCLLDETMPGEAMALNIVNKIINSLKFLYRKNSFLKDTSFVMRSYSPISIMHVLLGIQI